MPQHAQLDRRRLQLHTLSERHNKQNIERDHVCVTAQPQNLSAAAAEVVATTAQRMRQARAAGRPIMLTFGAHTIKNGLGPVLIQLLEAGWLTHLATNGAGIIHDWEFAYQYCSSEDVRANVAAGSFGLWQETGLHLNLALLLGAADGLGYGASVGRLITQQAHNIPSRDELRQRLAAVEHSAEAAETAAAAADLLSQMQALNLTSGWHEVPHPGKAYSVQAAAYALGIAFTGHPMIGHDIIYTHPMNCCAAIGRAAQRDFLCFAEQVSRIDGGVYLSIGSAVMSPMVFEKSMAMAQNLAIQAGRHIDNHYIAVVDLAENSWDWSQGEPPMDRPEYYLRYCKSFSRMGGCMRYATADNRDFLLALTHELLQA